MKTTTNDLAFLPKSVTKNTRKGRTILKPRVPIKLINNIGRSVIRSLCTVVRCYPLLSFVLQKDVLFQEESCDCLQISDNRLVIASVMYLLIFT